MWLGRGPVISTGFSRPGGSHSSPPFAHPLLPPAPHAPNSPRACLSLTARAKYLAEQAPAVPSPLRLLPIFPGGSAGAARDGKGPEPRVRWWTAGGKKGQERPVSILTTLSPVPGPEHGGQGEATSSKPVCLGGSCLHSYPFSNLPRGLSRAFPFSWANETGPASQAPSTPPHPPHQVAAQDRAEGIRRL